MDDYNWRLRLRSRKIKSHNRTATMLAIIMLALAVGSILWYFFIHARSPEYALDEIRDAVLSQDAEKFERYVNLDLATGKLYDDVTRDLFTEDTSLTPQTRAKATSFYQLIKPQVSAGIKTTLLSYAASGEWQLPGGLLRGRQLGIDFENFLERTQLKNITPVAIEGVDRDGSTATARIKAKDETTQTELTLLVAMEQSADGHWQVAYIKNYRDCLDRLLPLCQRDMNAYIQDSAPIVEQYNKKFDQLQRRFKQLTTTPWDSSGILPKNQTDSLKNLIKTGIIPTLKERQQKLSALTVPPGARYLSQLRAESTELSITAWEHFLKGLETDAPAEYDTAETVHKEALDVELRIDDILHHAAISRQAPALP